MSISSSCFPLVPWDVVTSPAPPQVRPDPVMANDTGILQGTRAQSWDLIGRLPSEPALLAPNWVSATARPNVGRDGRPAYSPIKPMRQKTHLSATKREMDLFGNRPVSPARNVRPGKMEPYEPVTKISGTGRWAFLLFSAFCPPPAPHRNAPLNLFLRPLFHVAPWAWRWAGADGAGTQGPSAATPRSASSRAGPTTPAAAGTAPRARPTAVRG